MNNPEFKTRLLAVSANMLEVRMLIASSQYPRCQSEAEHYLAMAETYRVNAAAAIVYPEKEFSMADLLALCEAEIDRAKAAASAKKQEQQHFVDGIYRKGEEQGRPKSLPVNLRIVI